jgi:hypothetical protein
MPRTRLPANALDAAPPPTAPRGSLTQTLAVPMLAALSCCAIILAAGELAAWLPPSWQGNWADHIAARQAHFIDRFFPFDAVWYQHIATDFYAWDPSRPGLKQDVAFFPVWPLVLKLIALCTPDAMAARDVTVITSAGFALASIVAFDALARRLLAPQAARTATWLFALYPGASFLLLSYPTGLMNLLCILALLALMQERYWAAAFCSALVTGIGPLGLGTAMAVFTMAAWRVWQRMAHAPTARRVRLAVSLVALGVLSISGLWGFLLWQWLKFADPFAFMQAQEAWAVQLTWPRRIPVALLQFLILPDFIAGLAELRHAVRAHTLVALHASLEKALYLAAEGLALIGVLASSRLACRPVLLQGAFTMLLFVWFHSTSRPGNSTLRLTYCVIGMFLGMAWLLRGRPRLALGVIVCCGFLLAGGAFLSAAGYAVV